jgi:hypothetical protein
MAQYELEDMSRYQMADRILFEDFKRYYELKQLTRNTVVLGQFVELRLLAWLREHVINTLYQGHSLYLGTGTIHVPQMEPDPRGQCDIVLYEALPGEIEFRQDDLVVVRPDAAWGIIETKSTITAQGSLIRALSQVRHFKEIAPNAMIYLFVRESMSTDALTGYLEQLSSRRFPVRMLPDAIILVEQQSTIAFKRGGNDIEQAIEVSYKQARDVMDRLQDLSEEEDVPYEELAQMEMGYIMDRYGYRELLSSFSERLGASPDLLTSLTAKGVMDIFGYRETVSSFLEKLIGDLEGKAIEIAMNLV